MVNPYFNGQYYLTSNPDVMAAVGLSFEAAEQHYVQHGASEALNGATSRKPAPWFDINYYLSNNPDLFNAGLTAGQLFTHFTTHGITEGRSPSAEVGTITDADLLSYAMANADLRAAFDIDAGATELTAAQKTQLLEHFYSHGYMESRPDALFDVGTGAPGQTFTLTTGIDNFTGTSGDDVFLASGTGAAGETLNPGDQLNGGAGTDTLKIYGTTAANFTTGSIKAIEIVENYTGAAIDVSGNADVTQAWAMTGGAATTATLSQTVGLADAAGTGAGGANVVTFNGATGSADAATIAVKDAGKTTAYADVTVANIETLTLQATGTNKLGTLIAADTETLVIAGEGTVATTLGAAGGQTLKLKSVDASASGGVTLTAAQANFGANEVKIAGGAGNDAVTFTGALTAKATVDLGDGKNTLEVNGGTPVITGSTLKAGAGTEDTLVLNGTGTFVDATTGKMFSGFENVQLKGTSTYSVGTIAGTTGFSIVAGGAANATLTKLGEAASVKISGVTTAGVQTLTLADNSAATASVKVVLDNGAAGKAAAAAVETIVDTNAHVLNIESAGNITAAGNNVVTLGATNSLGQITNIVVTGDQALDVVTGAATALTLIDGNAATGKLDINALTSAKSMTIKGGDAADTIVATTAAGAVSTITGGKGADKITLGVTAANNAGDVVKLTAQADSTAAGFDVITNFAGGTTTPANADFFDLKAFGFTGAQAASFTLGAAQVTTSGTAAAATFSIAATAATDFFANAGADKGVALYTTSTETFVFIDADKNGDWNAETDSVVLLVGDYSAGVGGDALVASQFLFV